MKESAKSPHTRKFSTDMLIHPSEITTSSGQWFCGASWSRNGTSPHFKASVCDVHSRLGWKVVR